MHNELLHIGPLTVYGYGFMIAMGVLAAWFVAEQRARKLKLACEHIFYYSQSDFPNKSSKTSSNFSFA